MELSANNMINDMNSLNGKTVAFMVAAGFNETEFSELQRRMVKSGAKIMTIAAENGVVNGWQSTSATTGNWGHYHPVDKNLADTLAADIDILVVPGGSKGVAKLSQNLHAKRILSHAIDGLTPTLMFGEASELLTVAEREAGNNVLVISELSTDEDGNAAWVEAAIAHMATDFLEAEEETRAAA